MRDTRREGAVGRNIGSAAFVSRHVRGVRAGLEAFSAVRLPKPFHIKQTCPAIGRWSKAGRGQQPRSHERDFLFSERLRIVPSVARSARPRAQTT